MDGVRLGLALSAVALAVASTGGEASAHQDGFGARAAPQAADPPEGFQPRLSAETGSLCVKQCPNDSLPCDPPSYKVADGRCTEQWR